MSAYTQEQMQADLARGEADPDVVAQAARGGIGPSALAVELSADVPAVGVSGAADGHDDQAREDRDDHSTLPDSL